MGYTLETVRAEGTAVVVTGSSGFVGRHLVTALLNEKWVKSVVGLDTEPHPGAGSSFKSLIGNTCEFSSLFASGALGRPDLVVHLGDYSRISGSFSSFRAVWESNIVGAGQVVQTCAENRVKLVYVGTSSTWGDTGSEASPYTWSKTVAAQLIRNSGRWFNLNYQIAFLSCVYGPGHVADGPMSTVVARFEHSVLHGIPLEVVLPGSQERAFTHISDTVAGLLLLLRSNQAFLEVGFVGRDLMSIEHLARLYNHPIVYAAPRRGDRQLTKVPKSLIDAASSLGWKPTHSLSSYVADWRAMNS